MFHPCLLSLGGVIVLAAALMAQPTVPDRAHVRGSAEPTGKRVESAAKKLAAGQSNEALDDLLRILDDAGDDLTTIDGSHFVPARWPVQSLLASLPPTTLATYRDRIDGPARVLLEAARKNRDLAPLWAIQERFFVSRPGEEALRLLGDRLFERGEIHTAERVWSRLVPSSQPDLAYPSPSATAAAGDLARLVLAAIFQGETGRAKSLLEELKSKHPDASGSLAGVTGPFASTLESLIAKPPTFPSDHRLPRSWPTLGAGPSRESRITGTLPRHWPSRPTWTLVLPPLRPVVKSDRGALPLPEYEPLLLNGRVLVSDGTQVFSIDLRTGERRSTLLQLEGPPGPPPSGSTRLFVRGTHANDRGLAESTIVSLAIPGPSARGEAATPRRLWSVTAPAADDGVEQEFLGPPLTANRRLWAVLARNEGGRVVHSVVCYEPSDSLEAPARPAWLTEICDASPATTNGSEMRRNTPTLAGRNVVVCSHAGAVVALDASTGRRAWAYRYARTASPGLTNLPDLAPPTYHAGRVFVAPADSDRVFALDAETGEKLWESGPCEGAHILGVTGGRVIVSFVGRTPGLRGLSIRNGSHRDPEGWVQQRSSLPRAFGSGLVSEDAIFWPTKSGLFVLHPDTGEPLAPPLRPYRDTTDTLQPSACFGPIAFADGCLIAMVPTQVGGIRRDQVWGYVLEPESR